MACDRPARCCCVLRRAVAGAPSNAVDLYNSATGTWTTARLSVARTSLAAASVGNVIVFAGGHIASALLVLGETWEGMLCVLMVDVIVFGVLCYGLRSPCKCCCVLRSAVAGGPGVYTDAVDLYNSATGTWTTARLSLRRNGIAAASVGNVVILAGGVDSNAQTDTVDLYNSATQQWTTAQLSSKRNDLKAATVNNVVVFAGTGDGVDLFNAPTTTSIAPTSAYVNSAITVIGANFIAGFACTAKVGATPSSGTAASSCMVASATAVVVVIGANTPIAASSVQVTFPNGAVSAAVPGVTLVVSLFCLPGFFSSAMFSSCSQCLVGQIQPLAGQISCMSCPPGKYCSTAGLTAATGECKSMSFSPGGAWNSSCTPCAQGNISTTGSSACQIQEHPIVKITMSGTIETFFEGSVQRQTFVENLAALLGISKMQIVIVAVWSGSINVELAFLRDVTSSLASPLDVVLRLKNAAAGGELDVFAVTGLTVGGQHVSLESSVSSSAALSSGILAAIVGSVIAASLVHSVVFVRVKSLKVTDSKGWIAASMLCGPFVWLIWSVREGTRKRHNKVYSNADIVVS